MGTKDILNDILDDTSEKLKEKWVRKIKAHSKKHKTAFHKRFLEMVKKNTKGSSYVLAHPHINWVDIYIVSIAYESPTGCLLVADDVHSKTNVFAGKVRGSTQDWGDVANTVFELLHEQMGSYPTAATLEHGVPYIHADSDGDGRVTASICIYVTDLDYIQRHEMSCYAYLKSKLVGVPDTFLQRNSFEYIDISTASRIAEMRSDGILSDNIWGFQMHLDKINKALRDWTPVSLSTFTTKLVLLVDYDNDVSDRVFPEREPPHGDFLPPPPPPPREHDHERLVPEYYGDGMCERMKNHHGKIRIRIK
jgi:hypothetical protein